MSELPRRKNAFYKINEGRRIRDEKRRKKQLENLNEDEIEIVRKAEEINERLWKDERDKKDKYLESRNKEELKEKRIIKEQELKEKRDKIAAEKLEKFNVFKKDHLNPFMIEKQRLTEIIDSLKDQLKPYEKQLAEHKEQFTGICICSKYDPLIPLKYDDYFGITYWYYNCEYCERKISHSVLSKRYIGPN
jgi:hypothetical protein